MNWRRGPRDSGPDQPGWAAEPVPPPRSLFDPPDRSRPALPPAGPPSSPGGPLSGPPSGPPPPPGGPPGPPPAPGGPPEPPHRGRFRVRGRVLVVAGVVVAVAAAGAGVAVVAGRDRPTCGARTAALRVTAAPDIAPLVAQVSRQVGEDESGCPLVAVRGQEPAETAELTGRGDQNGVDVWIPSSTLWLRLAAASGGRFPVAGASVARSPLVVAIPRPLAQDLGWTGSPPGWTDLADSVATGQLPALRASDPRTTTVGMLTVLAVNAETTRRSRDPGIAAMRALTVRSRLADATADVDALLRRAARATDAVSVRAVGAFPVTEQRLWAYSHGRPGAPLLAFYPRDGTVEADYPLAVSPAAAADPRRADLAGRLTDLLRAPAAARTRAGHGFRPPAGQDGEAPRAEGLAARYPAPVPLPAEGGATTTSAVSAWADYRSRAFRVLVLVDGSGSMNGQVRDRAGRVRTKADLLREAGAQAGALFGDETSVGLWEFSTQRADTPYEVIVPFGPINERLGGVSRRTVMVAAASRFQAVPGSGTPMYETVLRAVATMRDGHQADAVNMVVLLTDGHDESSPFQMSHAAFMSRLATAEDPKRPVPIFAIGYGGDADMTALTAMATATGGKAISSSDPADLAASVARVFLAVHTGR